VRGAIAAGAKGLELDPKTGVYRVILAGEADAAESPTDLLSKL
jgi:hypothetical protein